MTSPLQFPTPAVSDAWCQEHETHRAVAMAIHAISDAARSPEAIWADPTSAEWDHVQMAVENYVGAGIIPAEEDGRYHWGQEVVRIEGGAE